MYDGREQYKLIGNENSIHHGFFSSDNNQIVTISSDMTIRFWDLKNGNILFTLHLPFKQSDYPWLDFDLSCTEQKCLMAISLNKTSKIVWYEFNTGYK